MNSVIGLGLIGLVEFVRYEGAILLGLAICLLLWLSSKEGWQKVVRSVCTLLGMMMIIVLVAAVLALAQRAR